MKALRKIVKAENQKITVDLPDDFSGEQNFEIIILPAQQEFPEVLHRKFGSGKDQMVIRDSFYQPLEDFKEYM
jgi:hypothetical protein